MGSLASLGVVDGLEAIGLRGVVCFGDLVRFGADRPGLANVHDPRQQVVYAASSADVADVWVDGERRVMDGDLVGHDLPALVRASRPLAAELVRRADLGGLSQLGR